MWQDKPQDSGRHARALEVADGVGLLLSPLVVYVCASGVADGARQFLGPQASCLDLADAGVCGRDGARLGRPVLRPPDGGCSL